MKMTITSALLLQLLFHTTFAANTPSEILFLPWGVDKGQIQLTETPFGWESVESFQVIGDNYYLLTSNTGQILKYSDQTLSIWHRSDHIQAIDFQLSPLGELLYFMDVKQIYDMSGESGPITWVNHLDMRPNSRLLRSSKNKPAILLGLSETLLPTVSTRDTHMGKLNLSGEYGRLVRQSGSEMDFLLDEVALASFQLERGIWGSGQYLGSTEKGHHYLLLETLLEQNPLILKREVFIIDASGKLLMILEIPHTQHVPVTREFQLDKNGTLFGLFTTTDGIHLLGWDLSRPGDTPLLQFSLPQEFHNIHPRPFQGDNRLPGERHDEKSAGSLELDRLDFPPVGREEALNTADTYVALIWTAGPENLTDGVINDPAGHAIQTPTWIQVGQNQRMAYQWGGFSTIDGYVTGLANGKYAGDMETSDVSAYAVGVDCSGFVSRCWNMPQHYSTYMMSNHQPLITLPLDSWYDLRPGDAIHKVGHVRLTVLWNTNGTILAVEAGGGWITHYQSYTISQLADYQPRYYINMEGMPATIDRPIVGSVTTSDSTTISWTLSDTAGIQGVQLYQKDVFQVQDWEAVTDGLLSVDQTSIAFPSTDLSLAWCFRSVSDNTPPTESYPSDAYASAQKGSNERLLIIDGFDRTTGSYPFPYHDFALDMARSLGHFNYSYETADNDAVLAGSVDLTDYTAVFWLLGDESTIHETFSNQEQDIIEAYLRGGGKLFASGSEIAWDLDSQGNTADQSFFHEYLKAAYEADDSESYTITGVAGTPFEGLALHYDDGNGGVYEENYPDAFQTSGGSEAVLRYSNDMIAATAYTGIFGNGSSEGQVVLLGIPFETIYNGTEQLELTTSILSYFGLSVQLSSGPQNLPVALRLLNPFPSPFNSTTQIGFELAEKAHVELNVYDIRGRIVTNLVNQPYPAGRWQIPFHADGHPGGIYIIQVKSGSMIQSKKVILLK